MEFYLTAILQGLCLTGLVLGIYLSLKIFNIPDITTDGSYTLGAAISGLLLSRGWPAFYVLPVVLCCGALAGMATGLIHTKLKINALLSGILVMTGLYSVNLSIMGRSNIPLLGISGFFDWINISTNEHLNQLVLLLLFAFILIALISYVLKSDYGITMRATGTNDKMVRAVGVNTDNIKITGLAFANALTAASGFLMTQFQGFADINMGIGIVIVGLGSVIIAETFIQWRNINSLVVRLVLACAGAVVFQLILAFTLSIGIDPIMLKLVTALFVLLIVSLPRFNLSGRKV